MSDGGLTRPLDSHEWLSAGLFLDRPGGPNLDTCVGFLTAVATAASNIPPSEWLPTVLGDRVVAGPDDDRLVLVLRMFNTISKALSEEGVFHPDADQVKEIEHWCSGYIMGVDLDDIWISDIDAMTPVFPIAVLAGDQKLNEPDDEDPIEDEEAWLERSRCDLGGLAVDAFKALASARRRPPPVRGGWVRDKPKVGRNEPCPCGSDKKYKKCCLSQNEQPP